MIVELSPAVYVALCGLVQDAMQHPSDATHLLKQAAEELTRAVASDNLNVEESAEDAEAFIRIAAVG